MKNYKAKVVEHRELGVMRERLARWKGQTWEGFGAQPKGNWNHRKLSC